MVLEIAAALMVVTFFFGVAIGFFAGYFLIGNIWLAFYGFCALSGTMFILWVTYGSYPGVPSWIPKAIGIGALISIGGAISMAYSAAKQDKKEEADKVTRD